MQTHQKNTRSFRGNVALLASVFLLNLTFASLSYAAAMMEWSPTTGVVVGNAAGSNPSADEQVMTQIVRSDLSGTPYYYVSWYEQFSGAIKVTRYNANGVEQSGFPVTVKSNSFSISAGIPRIVSDNNGGAIIVWSDARNETGDTNAYDLFGERVDSTGARLWNTGGPDGILLVDSGFSDMIGDAVADGNGGVAIAYAQDHSIATQFDDYPFIIRIDGSGSTNAAWPTNGRSVVNTEDTDNCVHYSDLHMISVPDDGGEVTDSLPEYIVYYGPCYASSPGFQVGKILSSGTAAWSGPVTLPGTNGNAQAQDRLASDGAGGAYLFYHNNDFWFARHVDTDGIIDATFGEPSITTFSSNEEEISVIEDGAGGAVAAITVKIGITANIRAIRFDDTGTILWTQLVNIETGARDPVVLRDPAGNFVVLWKNETLDQVHFQRLNAASGTPQYGTDIILSGSQLGADTTPELHRQNLYSGGMSSQGSLAFTDNNEVLAVWDQLSVTNYIQKVDLTDGTIDLGTDAQIITANSLTPKNQLGVGGTRTSDGNYILFWHDARDERFVDNGPADIYAEKFSSDGTRLWNTAEPGKGLKIASDYGDDSSLEAVPTTDGGAIVVWEAHPGDSGAAREIYGQRVDANGNPLWGTNGLQLSQSAPFYSYSSDPEIVADGNDGAYVSWISSNDGGQDYILATHLQAADGSADPAWNGGTPTQVDNFMTSSNKQKMLSVDASNLVITYNEPGFTGSFLKAAKIQKSDGTLSTSWTSNPLTVGVPVQLYQKGLNVAADNAGGLYIAFSYQVGDFSDLGVQHVTTSGVVSFPTPNGIVVGDQSEVQSSPQIVSDNNGTPSGAIIAWNDFRGAQPDIYAQRINSNGTELWAPNGIAVSSTTDSTMQLMLPFTAMSDGSPQTATSNGGFGIIIPFTSATADPFVSDIYAQHLNSSGVAQWSPGGELVETDASSPGANFSIQAISDGNGGAVMTWLRTTDSGTTNDVYAQYISDTVGGICTEGGTTSFCGQQEINTASLSFTSIPDSFVFPSITASGTTQNIFNNGTASPPTAAGEDHDLLSVLDTRGDPGDGGLGGGFTVQVNNSTTFTDGSNTIPINNLYTVTATDDTSVAGTVATNGVMYEDIATIPTGTRNITAPVDAGNIGTTLTLADLETTSTFTSVFPGLPNPGSQFGNGDITLMNGTLPETQGRNGTMHQFINYYLTLPPANQISGSYTVILTFTLFDSTT